MFLNNQANSRVNVAANNNDSSPAAGFRVNYFNAIKEARSGTNKSNQRQTPVNDFSVEADNLKRDNSKVKSKFFKVSRYSASRKMDQSVHDEPRNEEEQKKKSASKSIISKISDEYVSSNDKKVKLQGDEDDNLALPPAPEDVLPER